MTLVCSIANADTDSLAPSDVVSVRNSLDLDVAAALAANRRRPHPSPPTCPPFLRSHLSPELWPLLEMPSAWVTGTGSLQGPGFRRQDLSHRTFAASTYRPSLGRLFERSRSSGLTRAARDRSGEREERTVLVVALDQMLRMMVSVRFYRGSVHGIRRNWPKRFEQSSSPSDAWNMKWRADRHPEVRRRVDR